MPEKIITKDIMVVEVEAETPPDKQKRVHLTDQDDKKHTIYKAVKVGDDWYDLEEAQELAENSKDKALRLTKARDGQYYRIIKVEPIEDVFKQEALKEIAQGPAPQEIGMWWKEVGEMLRAGYIKDKTTHRALEIAYFGQLFTTLGIKIEEAKDEADNPIHAQPVQPELVEGGEAKPKDAGVVSKGDEALIKAALKRLKRNESMMSLFISIAPELTGTIAPEETVYDVFARMTSDEQEATRQKLQEYAKK